MLDILDGKATGIHLEPVGADGEGFEYKLHKGQITEYHQVKRLLRHPARMQPILGTTNPTRVKDASKASDVKLTRQEWYAIYLAAGNKLP